MAHPINGLPMLLTTYIFRKYGFFINNLSTILTKAEAHAKAKKIEPSVLINARLAPDMFPLSRQIQIASDSVKGCAARLAGVEVPSFPDTETTFSELQAQSVGSTHQMVLGGLSLALATTVLGLLDAIPALVGYNYLKNTIRDFATEMEGFSNEILAAVELQYRKVDA